MKIAAFCLCWLLILTAPGVMAQQGVAPHQSWDILRLLQAGEKLRVERKTGKKVTGKMISLSDTELVIERKGKNVSFRRDEVKKVWRIVPPSRSDKMESARGWGGIGFILGMASALAIETSCGGDCEAEWVGAWVGITAGAALIGYFVVRGQRALIYSAP